MGGGLVSGKFQARLQKLFLVERDFWVDQKTFLVVGLTNKFFLALWEEHFLARRTKKVFFRCLGQTEKHFMVLWAKVLYFFLE